MKSPIRAFALLTSLSICFALTACGEEPEGQLPEETPGQITSAEEDTEKKSDALSFQAFEDDIGDKGTTETRVVFTTAASYRRYFGHDAPAGVDFSKSWVAFYSAGVKGTGGYAASITSISRSFTGLTLKLVTKLDSPGEGCIVTQALSKPYVLVKFARPAWRPIFGRYYRDDQTRDCLEGLCRTDADCTLAADYCTGCDCRALAPGETVPACEGPGVQCFAEACLTKRAACVDSHCVTQNAD